ncbi:MAG: pyridoxamine 5'-phosphate oxidase family protein [Chloroflexi bacterium]|nr:pyridoxamine 5'-phosphate oxidase family protein [Chloroflexota bacterium]
MKIIRDRERSVDLEEFLSRPLFAHLATASEHGPRESPVWFLWEDGALWIIGNRRTDTFPARIEHEPRCAMGIVDFDPMRGLVQHLGFRGKAFVERFDRDRAKRLLRRYLGEREEYWDPRFIESLGDPDNLFIRFVPETVVVRDVSYLQKNPLL